MDTERTYTKEIKREDGEFVAFMNGSLVGYYNSRHEAETALSVMAIEYLRRH